MLECYQPTNQLDESDSKQSMVSQLGISIVAGAQFNHDDTYVATSPFYNHHHHQQQQQQQHHQQHTRLTAATNHLLLLCSFCHQQQATCQCHHAHNPSHHSYASQVVSIKTSPSSPSISSSSPNAATTTTTVISAEINNSSNENQHQLYNNASQQQQQQHFNSNNNNDDENLTNNTTQDDNSISSMLIGEHFDEHDQHELYNRINQHHTSESDCWPLSLPTSQSAAAYEFSSSFHHHHHHQDHDEQHHEDATQVTGSELQTSTCANNEQQEEFETKSDFNNNEHNLSYTSLVPIAITSLDASNVATPPSRASSSSSSTTTATTTTSSSAAATTAAASSASPNNDEQALMNNYYNNQIDYHANYSNTTNGIEFVYAQQQRNSSSSSPQQTTNSTPTTTSRHQVPMGAHQYVGVEQQQVCANYHATYQQQQQQHNHFQEQYHYNAVSSSSSSSTSSSSNCQSCEPLVPNHIQQNQLLDQHNNPTDGTYDQQRHQSVEYHQLGAPTTNKHMSNNIAASQQQSNIFNSEFLLDNRLQSSTTDHLIQNQNQQHQQQHQQQQQQHLIQDQDKSLFHNYQMAQFKFNLSTSGAPNHSKSRKQQQQQQQQNVAITTGQLVDGGLSQVKRLNNATRSLKIRRGRPRKKSSHAKGKVSGKLWEFIRDLLLSERTNPSFIRWERREDGVFKFVQSDKVAKMWGERKQNPKMTYEKLSRAMRYYYKSKVLLPVFGRRLVYKFGPNATGWMASAPLLHASHHNTAPQVSHQTTSYQHTDHNQQQQQQQYHYVTSGQATNSTTDELTSLTTMPLGNIYQ